MNAIPQTNPRAGYLARQAEIDAAIARVMTVGSYILGPEVTAFETEFAAFVGVPNAVGVANGTDALTLALRAAGIGPGDVVVTASHTAGATVAGIELAGATPLLVDIDPLTFTLDPEALAAALARPPAGVNRAAIRAVVPVHLYGQLCDMPAIGAIAAREGLIIVEDCAQAHGATLDGRPAGAWGTAAAFSFYPTKNLGAFGDGGAVVTDDAALAARLRALREYGWRQRTIASEPGPGRGMNSRLDELQAAILRVKLPFLRADNQRRAAVAARYDAGLAGAAVTPPRRRPVATHVFHQYVIRAAGRDQLRERLQAQGIGTLIHYPVPVHRQPTYEGRVPVAGTLTHTEAACREILSLPMFPELGEADVERVVAAVVSSAPAPRTAAGSAITPSPATAFQKARVLVTGGLGFIGSNLAARLCELGADVTLVDTLIPTYGGNLFNIDPIKSRVRVNISDVRDQFSFQYLVRGQDFLFNLAGQTSHMDSMLDPFTDLDINCRAQLSILEACRHHNPKVKVVFASTRQLYGKPDYQPVDEKHLLRPVDVNGINKMAGECYHILYNNVYGVRACALRLTNTYGPRMRIKDARQTFLGIWIRTLLEGRPFEVWGGDQLRDFTYVDDAVDALLRAALTERSNGMIYNVGGHKPVTLKALAELLIKVAGAGSYVCKEFPADRKRIDIGDYYADDRLIREELGWAPGVSLAEGLRRAVEYFRANLEHYC